MRLEDKPKMESSSPKPVSFLSAAQYPDAQLESVPEEVDQPVNHAASTFAHTIFGLGLLEELGIHGDHDYATSTSLLSADLPGNGLIGAYSWAAAAVPEQHHPACRHGGEDERVDSSTCRRCLQWRSERVRSAQRGGPSRPGVDRNKDRKPRRQFSANDEPYPYPPRNNRRFPGSGSGSMQLSVTGSEEVKDEESSVVKG